MNDAAGLDAVAARLSAAGPFSRPMRAALEMLRSGATVRQLVETTGLPRREIEHLLADLGDDAAAVDGVSGADAVIRLRPALDDQYRHRLGPSATDRAPGDGLGERLAAHAATVARMSRTIEAAPAPERDFDHVPATAETAVRRALWMDSAYDLDRAHLLCVGDHDLTSLATAMVNPQVAVTVVDIDERTLEYVDRVARANGWNIRCLWGDLRLGLPPSAIGRADLVFTDPPYTPEGVHLFVLRGLQGLGDTQRGRVLMAYGYGDHQPALGLKVQEAVQSMHLAFEAILRGFNRYHGAQAIGSRSDLYVCRPTPRTWRLLPRLTARADPRIYTHGEQSLESRADAIAATAVEALLGPLRSVPEPAAAALLLVGRRWPADAEPAVEAAAGPVEQFGSTARVQLDEALGGYDPPSSMDLVVAADLADDPGPWLLRLLLAVNAQALTVLVPNAHAAVSSEAGLAGLRGLIEAKYTLRVRRNTPDRRYSVVEAHATMPAGPDTAPEDALEQYLLLRSRRKIGTVWRDGLVAIGRRRNRVLAKTQARAVIDEYSPDEWSLEATLLELPRHQMTEVVAAVRGSAGPALDSGRRAGSTA